MFNAKDRIIAIACHLLAKRGVRTTPQLDANLRQAGLTPPDIVNLLLTVEAEFDIAIAQSATTPDNLNTIAAIESLVSMTLKAA